VFPFDPGREEGEGLVWVLSEFRKRLVLDTICRYDEGTTSLIWSAS